MSRQHVQQQRGMSLIEVLIGIALVALIVPTILSFLWGGFNLNRRVQGAMLNQQEARRLMDWMKRNLREANYGENNEYPLISCGSNELIYYADSDEDDTVERIRLFQSGSELRRGIVEPVSGVYDTDDEVVDVVMGNIVNGAGDPIFRYYDATYDGTGSALSTPVACGSVRLIEVRFLLDTVLELQPGAFEVDSMIQLRNLKFNL